MKFGVHIGAMGGPLAEMRKLWKFADAKGFDWFSVSDHFQESPPRGGDMDCYEAIAILTAAAKYADGWNGAYIGPDDWKHKGQVLDRWCETEGRDPKTIMRAVNLGFYLGADAKGIARADELWRSHFGGSPARAERTGYLKGSVKDAREMVDQFRALGCTRLSIALREGPYDWDALEAFAAEIVRAR